VTDPVATLSRRERQIMDILHRMSRATAAEVHAQMAEAPHPSAVRTLLRILEEKGHVRHVKDGPRHVYMPTTTRRVAQRSAVRHLIRTFFNGSPAAAVAALVDDAGRPLTKAERDELAAVLRELRARGE